MTIPDPSGDALKGRELFLKRQWHQEHQRAERLDNEVRALRLAIERQVLATPQRRKAMALLCLLGIHSWRRSQGFMAARPGKVVVLCKKTCRRCGKTKDGSFVL